MDSRFECVYQAIQHAQLNYCVLRAPGASRPDSRTIELDVLLRRQDLPLFTSTVAALGYLPLKSWGHRPHYFFVAFDQDRGQWLKLDVVVDLTYGAPIRFLRVDLTDECLAARKRHDGVHVLAPEHEIVTLLLHCLLDKGAFRDHHKRRLAQLAEAAVDDAELYAKVSRCLAAATHDALLWNTVSKEVERGDWSSLLTQRPAVARRLFWAAPAANVWRKVRNRGLRTLRPVLHLLFGRGASIALLAPDGAGKTTIAKTLAGEDILRAQSIYMGTNLDSSTVSLPSTAWISRRLQASHAGRPDRGLLRAAAFVNRVLQQWLRCAAGLYHKARGRLVVFDRYGYDGFLAAPQKHLGKRLRRALLTHMCVAPDLVFLLDAPGQVLYERKREHSPERLEKQRQAYLAMRGRIPNMIVIDATRPLNEVYCEILGHTWRRYAGIGKGSAWDG